MEIQVGDKIKVEAVLPDRMKDNHYFTNGKEYEGIVSSIWDDLFFFTAKENNGDKAYCRSTKDGHIGFNDWIIKEKI